jgi:hypothetical protein
LEEGEIAAGGEHRADVALRPAAARLVLVVEDALEGRVLELAPGHPRFLRVVGEHLAPLVLAQCVHGLAEVVRLVLVVALAALAQRDVVLAVLEPLLGQLALVLAGAEAAADGRRGDRRAPLPLGRDAAAGVAVDHASIGGGAGFEVVHGLVDILLRDRDAGVLGGAQALQRGDRDRALVEVAAVLRADVAPTADLHGLAFGLLVVLLGLGVADELDRLLEELFEFLALFLVFFFAVDRREEQRAEALAVHVPRGFSGVPHVADHAVGLLPRRREEPLDRLGHLIGVLPFLEGAAFHQERHARNRGHRGRVLTALRLPVAVLLLLLLEVLETLVDGVLDLLLLVLRLLVRRLNRRGRRDGDETDGDSGREGREQPTPGHGKLSAGIPPPTRPAHDRMREGD